jgi:hypothetical protein
MFSIGEIASSQNVPHAPIVTRFRTGLVFRFVQDFPWREMRNFESMKSSKDPSSDSTKAKNKFSMQKLSMEAELS